MILPVCVFGGTHLSCLSLGNTILTMTSPPGTGSPTLQCVLMNYKINQDIPIRCHSSVFESCFTFSAERWVLVFCSANFYVVIKSEKQKISTSRWAAVFWTLMYWSAGPGFCNNRWPPFALIASICTRRPPLAVFLLFAFIFVHNCKDYFFYLHSYLSHNSRSNIWEKNHTCTIFRVQKVLFQKYSKFIHIDLIFVRRREQNILKSTP